VPWCPVLQQLNWDPCIKTNSKEYQQSVMPHPYCLPSLSLRRTIGLPITQMNAVLLLGEPMHLHCKVVALTNIMQWCRSLQLLVALSDKVPIYNSKLSMVVEHFRSTLATYYPHGPLNETTWHISCWLCCVFNFHKIKIYASNSKILNFWPLGHSYSFLLFNSGRLSYLQQDDLFSAFLKSVYMTIHI
jgi:hypothetical protein